MKRKKKLLLIPQFVKSKKGIKNVLKVLQLEIE